MYVDFAKEMHRRPMLGRPPRMVSKCTAKEQGQLALPGIAFCNSSEAKCWFAAPNTLQACEAVMMTDLVDPDSNNARLIEKNTCESEPCPGITKNAFCRMRMELELLC